MANLRQIGMAVTFYENENGGYLPSHALDSTGTGATGYGTIFRWVGIPGSDPDFAPITSQYRPLDKYLNINDNDADGVWRCPSDETLWPLVGTSYGMNLFIPKGNTDPQFTSLYISPTQSVKVTQIHNSSNVIVGAEQGANVLAWMPSGVNPATYITSGYLVDGKTFKGYLFWHTNQRTWNALFADGHCEGVNIAKDLSGAFNYLYSDGASYTYSVN